MGYESRLNIVRVNKYEDFTFCERIAVFDLCGTDMIGIKMKEYPEFPYAIYPLTGEGGNIIEQDCYGKKLTEVPVSDAIDIVRADLRRDIEKYGYKDVYWRLKPCLALLEAFEGIEDIVVLHYGY